jgi:hypothetical protein
VLKVFVFPFDLIHAIQGFIGRSAASKPCRRLIRLAFCAESSHDKDDQADQQNQPNSTAANQGASKVKSAAAKQKKQNQ